MGRRGGARGLVAKHSRQINHEVDRDRVVGEVGGDLGREDERGGEEGAVAALLALAAQPLPLLLPLVVVCRLPLPPSVVELLLVSFFVFFSLFFFVDVRDATGVSLPAEPGGSGSEDSIGPGRAPPRRRKRGGRGVRRRCRLFLLLVFSFLSFFLESAERGSRGEPQPGRKGRRRHRGDGQAIFAGAAPGALVAAAAVPKGRGRAAAAAAAGAAAPCCRRRCRCCCRSRRHRRQRRGLERRGPKVGSPVPAAAQFCLAAGARGAQRDGNAPPAAVAAAAAAAFAAATAAHSSSSSVRGAGDDESRQRGEPGDPRSSGPLLMVVVAVMDFFERGGGGSRGGGGDSSQRGERRRRARPRERRKTSSSPPARASSSSVLGRPRERGPPRERSGARERWGGGRSDGSGAVVVAAAVGAAGGPPPLRGCLFIVPVHLLLRKRSAALRLSGSPAVVIFVFRGRESRAVSHGRKKKSEKKGVGGVGGKVATTL